jgi:hypothetical protein
VHFTDPDSFPMQVPTHGSSGTSSAAKPLSCCMSETNSSALGAFTSASGSSRCSPHYLMIGLRLDFKTPNSGIGNVHLFSACCKVSMSPTSPSSLPFLAYIQVSYKEILLLVHSCDYKTISTRLVLLCVFVVCLSLSYFVDWSTCLSLQCNSIEDEYDSTIL